MVSQLSCEGIYGKESTIHKIIFIFHGKHYMLNMPNFLGITPLTGVNLLLCNAYADFKNIVHSDLLHG